MIDLHSHILPGVDDGAATLQDSRELARRALADGVEAIAATPHVRADYPTSARRMQESVAALRRDFEAEGIALAVLPGGEIDLERLETLADEELAAFSLGGSGRYVLLEFPYRGWPLALEQTVFDLRLRGLRPVIAHPERSRDVQQRPERLAAAVAGGALVQVTAASLDGRLGRRTRAAAERLLEQGLVHVLASDAHGPEVREAGLLAAARALRDDGLARHLTTDAPAAIVAGEPVPSTPAVRRRAVGLRDRLTRRR